jgi:hypothetical protein
MRISDSHRSRARENESFLAVDGFRGPLLIEHGARLIGSHRLIICDRQGRTVRAESFHNLVTTAGWTEVTAGQVSTDDAAGVDTGNRRRGLCER